MLSCRAGKILGLAPAVGLDCEWRPRLLSGEASSPAELLQARHRFAAWAVHSASDTHVDSDADPQPDPNDPRSMYPHPPLAFT